MTERARLVDFLESQTENRVSVPFDRLAEILGRPLPPGAMRTREWWATEGDPDGVLRLNRRWKVEAVDSGSRLVTFLRDLPEVPEPGAPVPDRQSDADFERAADEA